MPTFEPRKDSPTTAPEVSTPAAIGGGARGLQMKKGPYVQQKESVRPGGTGYQDQRAAVSPAGDAGAMHETARAGVASGGEAMPHLDSIQNAFGDHDVSGVSAHVGGPAGAASEAMGAEAYATGDDVAFAKTPDLHTAAHEAAHVVQQRDGVQLKGGIGESGDDYEKNADAVADRVVAGESAADLLPGGAAGKGAAKPGQGVQTKAVQLLGKRLDEDTKGTNAETKEVAYSGYDERTGEYYDSNYSGEKKKGRWDQESGTYKQETVQRQYSFGQYQKMWEEEKGRPMTETELQTLKRGCIGITVLNLGGSGNPPHDEAYNTFDQAHARMKDIQAVIDTHPDATVEDLQKDATIKWNLKFDGKLGDHSAVLFAQLFWSNQQVMPGQAMWKQEHSYGEGMDWKTDPLPMPGTSMSAQEVHAKWGMRGIQYFLERCTQDEYATFIEGYKKIFSEENAKKMWEWWYAAAKEKDAEAFKVDDTLENSTQTGKVNMEGYLWNPQPRKYTDKNGDEKVTTYVNFDFGFWDDSTGTFWHANHCMYDPKTYGDEKAQKQPMVVYQSTPDVFAKEVPGGYFGYTDFDRIVYCVGMTKNYNPAAAAISHG